jgi:hypothetical protein
MGFYYPQLSANYTINMRISYDQEIYYFKISIHFRLFPHGSAPRFVFVYNNLYIEIFLGGGKRIVFLPAYRYCADKHDTGGKAWFHLKRRARSFWNVRRLPV